MDEQRFDHFTRALAGTGSRRRVLRHTLGVLAGGIGAGLLRSGVRAQEAAETPVPTEVVEPAPTEAPTEPPAPTETPTPEPTEIPATPTPESTAAPTETPTVEATATPSATPAASETATATPSPTKTPGRVKATVVDATLTLSADSGVCQTAIRASITGFKANERISLRFYHTTTSYQEVAAARANASGLATLDFLIPNAVGGTHTVRAAGSSGMKKDAAFTVKSSVALNRSSGLPGQQVKATLRGFDNRATLELRWHDGPERSSSSRLLGSKRASTYGTAAFTFSVPADTPAGEHIVVAAQSGGGSRSATFSVPADGSFNSIEDGAGTWTARYCEECSKPYGQCTPISCDGLVTESPAPRVSDPTGQRGGKVLKLGKKALPEQNFTPYTHVLYGSRICSEVYPGDTRPCAGVHAGVAAAKAFEVDLWFMYSPKTGFNYEPGEPTRIQAIEFGVALWLDETTPKLWDFGWQWVVAGVGTTPRWRIFGRDSNGYDGWLETGVSSDRFAAGTWHRLTVRVSIAGPDRGRRYDGIAIDGVWQSIDTSTTHSYREVPAASDDLAIHVQLDGPMRPPDNYDVYLDNVNVAWYDKSPW